MSDTIIGTVEEIDEKVGVLEESKGVKSSKRLFGAILISCGGALLMAIGIVAIFRKIVDAGTALEAGKALIITGAALLGVGVLEGIRTAITARKIGGAA